LTRRIVLRPPPKQLAAVDLPNARLFDVGGYECMRLANELACWLEPASGCGAYFNDQKIDVAMARGFLTAYFAWPTDGAANWWQIANQAMWAMPHPGADHLAAAALGNDLRTTRCNSKHLTQIRLLAKEIRAHAAHDRAIDADLALLIDEPHRLCFAL
jgi:hypothetical protein